MVSIIITTYKGSDNIERAVNSCLNQTYKDIEVIVVDDNGKGTEEQYKTGQKLAALIADKKICYICHEKNRNASVARNTGANAAKGELLAFLDDDDEYEKDKIERQVSTFDKSPDSVGVVYCGRVNVFGGKAKSIKSSTYNGRFTYDYLMTRVSACTSTIMVKRNVFMAIGGFDESFRRHQDWEFMVRLSTITEIASVPNYVGIKKHCLNSVTRFNPEQAEEYRNYYLDKLKHIIEALPEKERNDVYAYHYNEMAKLYFRKHQYNDVKRCLQKGNKTWWFIRDIIKAIPHKAIAKMKLKMNIIPVVKG